jgi:hypothetical protein
MMFPSSPSQNHPKRGPWAPALMAVSKVSAHEGRVLQNQVYAAIALHRPARCWASFLVIYAYKVNETSFFPPG